MARIGVVEEERNSKTPPAAEYKCCIFAVNKFDGLVQFIKRSMQHIYIVNYIFSFAC